MHFRKFILRNLLDLSYCRFFHEICLLQRLIFNKLVHRDILNIGIKIYGYVISPYMNTIKADIKDIVKHIVDIILFIMFF